MKTAFLHFVTLKAKYDKLRASSSPCRQVVSNLNEIVRLGRLEGLCHLQ